MANLLASLSSAAGALSAYDQVLDVIQNNVANASTPGYAAQNVVLTAMRFDPSLGVAGGVQAGHIQSTRDAYSEQAVWRQNVLLGQDQQNVDSLTALQSIFDISGKTGIPLALNNLFQSFSTWSASPDDQAARQTVIARAGQVASAFNQAATALNHLTSNTDTQLSAAVDQVNRLLGQIQSYNAEMMRSSPGEPGLDSQIHAALENLSQYIDFTALRHDNGSVDILLNSSVPLLLGTKEYQLSFDLAQPQTPPPVYADGPPHARIRTADGADVTAQITTGQLGALVDFRNRVLPSYMGDGAQQGSLNAMAQQLADRVNYLLTSGQISAGQSGIALFEYEPTGATHVAHTLAVNPLEPEELAATDPGPPTTANGIPLALAELADPQRDEDTIDGASFTEYYGQMASLAGSALQTATNGQQVQQSLVAQARNLRQQVSGVSLDHEAALLIQFQRAYEANSRLITVLNQLSADTINILSS